MARNKFIKFCDNNRISDGLLREFLYKELPQASLDQINAGIGDCYDKVNSLTELRKLITTEMEGVDEEK